MSEFICGINTGDTNNLSLTTSWTQILYQPEWEPQTGDVAVVAAIKGYIACPDQVGDVGSVLIRVTDLVTEEIIATGSAGLVEDTTQWYTFTLSDVFVQIGYTWNIKVEAALSEADTVYWRRNASVKPLYEFWGTIDPLPEKPINPTPSNTADDITLDQSSLAWESGSPGGYPDETYNVYFGPNAGALSLISAEQPETSITISGIDYGSPFDYLVSRTWRIDAVNEYGTTEGDIWDFTTIRFLPPVSYGGVDEDGDGYGDGTGYDLATRKRLICAAGDTFFYEEL